MGMKSLLGSFMAVQWLTLQASTAGGTFYSGGTGSIPDWGIRSCMPCGATKKKCAAKRHETLEVPVLSGQKASRERALYWDASQLFQASRTSDPSSITLGILLYFKIRHIIIITC